MSNSEIIYYLTDTNIFTGSTPAPVQEPNDEQGWYYTGNVATEQLKVELFDGTNQTVLFSNLASISMKFKAYDVTQAKNPQIIIQSKPTGSGDADPAYHSQWVYKLNQQLQEYEEVLGFIFAKPSQQQELRAFQMGQDNSSVGDLQPDEEIKYIYLITDSAQADIELLLKEAVVNSKNLTIGNFTRSILFKSFHDTSASGLATEAKQDDMITKLTEIDTAIDSIDGKITSGNDDSITGNLQQNLVYGRYDFNGDLKAMKCSSDGSVITAPAGGTIITTDGTTSEQRVMILGNYNGNLRTIKCGDGGAMNVEMDHSWDNTNTLFSVEPCPDGATITSSTFDLGQGVSHELGIVEFFVTNSATVPIDIVPEASYNGTVWYSMASASSINSSKQYVAFSQEEIGIGVGNRYMRFQVTNNDGLGTSTNITMNVGYYK